MAKYNVLFACGHSEEKELFGKSDDRKKRIEYWGNHGICSACYRAQQDEERAAAKKNAEAAAKAANLPAMTGSEKQINWAITIRADMMSALDAINVRAAEMIAAGTHVEVAEAAAKRADAVRAYISAKTEAVWFIDHRASDYNRLFVQIANDQHM